MYSVSKSLKKYFLALFNQIKRAQILPEGPKVGFYVFCWLSWTILHQNDISHAISISNPLIYPPIKIHTKNILGPISPNKRGPMSAKNAQNEFYVFL